MEEKKLVIVISRGLDDERASVAWSTVTLSTWAVWGKRSNARTSTTRYAPPRPRTSRANVAGSQLT